MSSANAKFTIYEVHVAIYPTNDDDEVTGDALFLGCCFERADCTRNHVVKQRPFLGQLHQRNYNEDETHTIELSNPLQLGPEDELKQLDRFGRYALVLVWHDEERQCWLKRSYYGVVDVVEQVGGDVVAMMGMTLRAERLVQTPGRNEWPTMTPESQFGVVYYTLGASRTPLYGYGGGFVFFELPTFDSAKGEITPASGTLSFYVEGQLAMQATEDDLLVKDIVALGGSYYDTPEGKLEFVINNIRVATLGKDGTLAVPDIAESEEAPSDPADIELRIPPLNQWTASIGIGVTTARNFSEYL